MAFFSFWLRACTCAGLVFPLRTSHVVYRRITRILQKAKACDFCHREGVSRLFGFFIPPRRVFVRDHETSENIIIVGNNDMPFPRTDLLHAHDTVCCHLGGHGGGDTRDTRADTAIIVETVYYVTTCLRVYYTLSAKGVSPCCVPLEVRLSQYTRIGYKTRSKFCCPKQIICLVGTIVV